MNRIIRTKTEAKGGITDAERSAMKGHTEKWIGIALQTGRCDKEKLTEAIHGIYAAANLKKPRVVVAASPLAMAMAYGAASAIWYQRGENAKIRNMEVAATNTVARDKSTKDGVLAPDVAITQSSDMYTRTEVHSLAYPHVTDSVALSTYTSIGEAAESATASAYSGVTQARLSGEVHNRATDAKTRAGLTETVVLTREVSHNLLDQATFNELAKTTENTHLMARLATDFQDSKVNFDASTANYLATDFVTDYDTDTRTRNVVFAATNELGNGVTTDGLNEALIASNSVTNRSTDSFRYNSGLSENLRESVDQVTRFSISDGTYTPILGLTGELTDAAVLTAANAAMAAGSRTVAEIGLASYSPLLQGAYEATDFRVREGVSANTRELVADVIDETGIGPIYLNTSMAVFTAANNHQTVAEAVSNKVSWQTEQMMTDTAGANYHATSPSTKVEIAKGTELVVDLSHRLKTSAIDALLDAMDITAEISGVSFSIPHESAVMATDNATRIAVDDATAMRVLSETSLTTDDAASRSLLATFNDKTLAVDATPRLPVRAVHPEFSFKNTEATDYETRVGLDLTTDTHTSQVTYSATRQALMAAVSLYDGVDTGPWPSDSTISFEVNLAMDKIFIASSAATDLMTTDSLNYEASFSNSPAAFLRGLTVRSVGEAMYSPKTTPEQQAAQACFDAAGPLGLACAKRWTYAYQGGNMRAGYAAYASAFRDILGLDLPEYKAFAHYEAAAMHGGFRVMHEEFCIVSDFPDVIKKDEANLPHCEDGPSHKWSDGWSLYHWHGVKVPAEWIENKASLTAKAALAWPNIEQRRAACEILGWAKIVEELDAKVIDRDGDPEIGTLLEVELPDSGKERFIYVKCGTSRFFALPVPLNMETAMQANAWTYGLDEGAYKPEVRT